MKYILPTLATAFLFSCTTYQVMTVSSREAAQQNTAAEFVIDNDSLELCYNFNGHNGPIKVKIRNKLNKPIYVDWQRSALIINGMAISYANQKVPISGALSSTSLNWTPDVSSSYGRFHGTATIPPDIEFIPPQTFVTKELIGITNKGILNLPESAFSKKKVPAMGSMFATIKLASFSPASTPLSFSSYLTFMVGDTLPRPMVYQHNFYVSELVKMTDPPEMLNGDKRGDRFYVVQGNAGDSITYGYGVVGGKPVLQKYARSMQ